MINEKDIKEVGKIQKTHALKGELNALLDIDAEFFEDGNPLILDIDGIYVPFFLKSVRPKGTMSYLITIEGVDSESEARQLVNKTIYASREDLLDYYEEEDLEFADELEGYEVVDNEHGRLGVVKEIDDTTENVLMVVDRQGDEADLYIPYSDAFVENINDEERRVYVSIPDGLLGLN